MPAPTINNNKLSLNYTGGNAIQLVTPTANFTVAITNLPTYMHLILSHY